MRFPFVVDNAVPTSVIQVSILGTVGQLPHSLSGSHLPEHMSKMLAPKMKLSPQKQFASEAVFIGGEYEDDTEHVVAASSLLFPRHDIW